MKLTYICPDLTTVEFSKSSTDYRLLKPTTGFANPTPRFQTAQGPTQNGATLLDTHIDPKELSFDIMITAANLQALQVLVARLVAAFNPLNGPGYLVYEYEDGTEYTIQCIGNGAPKLDPVNKSLTHWAASIPLTAFVPFWSTTETIIPITVGATSWIPWYVGSWIISGWGGLGTAINLGTQTISCKIDVCGGTGSITNPKITKVSTGEYILISKVLVADECFSINTDENILTATYTDASGNEYNGYPYLSVGTTFFQLSAGSNLIRVSADDATDGGYVNITKADKFVGV